MVHTDSESPVDVLIAECAEALRNGKRADCLALAEKHAEHSAEIAAFLDNFDRIEKHFAPLRELTSGTPCSAAEVATIGQSDTAVPPPPKAGGSFGDYDLLTEVARGGMGVVYKARQKSLNRVVALKMVLGGQRDSSTDRDRFLVEARAVARLNHPHIVPIYEVGEYDGQPYFTMEFFSGGSLRDQFDKLRGDQRDVARLMVTVARAVEHAHRRGILHRDIKPNNVLLDERGEPHVTDFGLAKRLDEESDLTQAGAIVGTPSYMAPEQANAETDLTTAADVYGLGALMYELLTGRPPFKGNTPLETMMAAVSQEPQRPRRLAAGIETDLETVCLKCLEKDPLARYSSADALADDLERWLVGKPIHARPVTTTERIVKWSRRQPLLAGSLATVFVAVLGLLVLAGFLWQNAEARAEAVQDLGEAETKLAQFDGDLKQAEAKKSEAEKLADEQRKLADDQRKLADKIATKVDELQEAASAAEQKLQLAEQKRNVAERDARLTTYAADMQLAHVAWQTENLAAVGELLNRYRKPNAIDPRGFEWNYLNNRLHTARLEWNAHNSPGSFQPICSLAVSPDGKLLASWDRRKSIMLWSLRDGKLVKSIEVGGRYPHAEGLAFSDDGRTLVAAIYKGGDFGIFRENKAVVEAVLRKDKFDLRQFDEGFELRSWNVAEDKPAQVTPFDLETFSGSLLSVASNGVRLQHDGEAMFTHNAARSPDGKFIAFAGAPLTIDKQRKRVAGGGRTGRLLVWDVSNKRVHLTQDAPSPISAVAFSPDGKHLAIGNLEGVVGVAELDGHKPPRLFVGHKARVCSLCFSSEGSRLFSSAEDGQIIEWDVAAGKETTRRRGHTSPVVRLAISADDRTLASGGSDGALKVWDLDRKPDSPVLRGHETFVVSLAFTPDGSKLISVDDNGQIKTWDTADGKLHSDTSIPARGELANSLTCNGQSLAWKDPTDVHSIIVRNLLTGKDQRLVWKDHYPWSLALSADDELAAAGDLSPAGGLTIWNIADSEPVATLDEKGSTYTLTISPDKKLVIAGRKGGALIWDWEANQSRHVLTLNERHFMTTALTVSADNKILAIASASAAKTMPAKVRLWDLKTDKLIAEYQGAGRWVRRLIFSPDGRRLAIAGDGTAGQALLKLWDTSGGREVFSAALPAGKITALALSPDGHRLAAAIERSHPTAPLKGEQVPVEIHIWDATPRESGR